MGIENKVERAIALQKYGLPQPEVVSILKKSKIIFFSTFFIKEVACE